MPTFLWALAECVATITFASVPVMASLFLVKSPNAFVGIPEVETAEEAEEARRRKESCDIWWGESNAIDDYAPTPVLTRPGNERQWFGHWGRDVKQYVKGDEGKAQAQVQSRPSWYATSPPEYPASPRPVHASSLRSGGKQQPSTARSLRTGMWTRGHRTQVSSMSRASEDSVMWG